MEQENRVVVLIDMDCFYCQVEEKLDPELKGKPIAVVQYNPWKGGGIIAVNYVARAMGVTRHMRGDEAKAKCPEIQLPSVPCNRGKADISKYDKMKDMDESCKGTSRYREAGKEVARVLQKFTPLLERASIDEAYLDITDAVETRLKSLSVSSITPSSTPNTFALGYDSFEDFISDVLSSGSESIDFDCDHATRLLVGAVVVSEIRAQVYEETGYRCSAGIAHNKILAKLVCGMNKPDKQTVLPKHCVNILYKTLPLKKVKHLGGKFGDSVCELLRITHMAELQRFTEKELQTKFDEKNGTWLYNIARGTDLEPVQTRFNPKSIGCCKQFRGRSALLDLHSVQRWLNDLAQEIEDRLDKDALENNRTPRQMVVSFSSQLSDGRDVSSSRSHNFTADDELGAELFAAKALQLLLDSTERVKHTESKAKRKLKAPITFLGISVGKFEDDKKTKKIVDYFAAGPANASKTNTKQNNDKESIEYSNVANNTEHKDEKVPKNNKKDGGKDYILKKFFQVTDKEHNKKENDRNSDSNYYNMHDKAKEENLKTNKEVIHLNTDLDKQESFFAKLLNSDNNNSRPSSALSTYTEDSISNVRATTPQCKVVDHGEDSNGTDYSTSTINAEINKSIALFDEDPEDVVRVSKMREMLSKTDKVIDNRDESGVLKENDNDVANESESSEVNGDRNVQIQNQESNRNNTKGSNSSNKDNKNISHTELNTFELNDRSRNTENKAPSPQSVDHFECPDCKKIVAMTMVDEHADYHLALTLREEERQHARNKNRERTVKVKKDDPKKKNDRKNDRSKNDVGSISSFLVKLDDTLPTETCTECGKKVQLERFREHLDFHEAQKLNREINKRTAPSYFTGSGVKKRKTVSPVEKTKTVSNSKSIDSFFK